jgi:hypothetical protein
LGLTAEPRLGGGQQFGRGLARHRADPLGGVASGSRAAATSASSMRSPGRPSSAASTPPRASSSTASCNRTPTCSPARRRSRPPSPALPKPSSGSRPSGVAAGRSWLTGTPVPFTLREGVDRGG